MGEELETVGPGDPFQPSADHRNATVEAIRQVRHWEQSGGALLGRNIYNQTMVMVRNDSGADRDQYDVLAIGDSLIAPASFLNRFKAQVRVSGVKPTYEHWGKIVVLRRPIKKGKMGPAIGVGITPARVRLNHPGDEYAELSDGDPAVLDSQTGGGSARIKWVDPGEGIRWAIVELGVVRGEFGVEYAQDCPGGSIEFKVWVGRWNPSATPAGWSYDRSKEFWAIDHRNVSQDLYPDKCATGLAEWRPHKEHGRIAEINVADCFSPGCYGYGY